MNIAMDDEAGSVEYMSVSHWDVAGHAVLDSASQSGKNSKCQSRLYVHNPEQSQG